MSDNEGIKKIVDTEDLPIYHKTEYVGSIKNLISDVDEVIKVANLHEARYHDKWLGSNFERTMHLVLEKADRLDTMTNKEARLEELYDLCVYSLFAIHKAREELKDFKYPDTKEKTDRDHD